jgi:Mg2+-importing ATPase
VVDVCARFANGAPLDRTGSDELRMRYEQWSCQGIRVLAIAARQVDANRPTAATTSATRLHGVRDVSDRPKDGVSEAIAGPAGLGVSVKLITGDNALVAQHVAALVGIHSARVLTGRELDDLHDEALWHAAERTDLFVEVDPNQKERIILSLKKMGHVVGFLGDGVNDAPAMHAPIRASAGTRRTWRERPLTSSCWNRASTDPAGHREGRKTFANTLKYVLITTSANLQHGQHGGGVTVPAVFTSPPAKLAQQLRSDVPAVGLAGDSVDPARRSPALLGHRLIGRYMLEPA